MQRINPKTKKPFKYGDIEIRNGKEMLFRCYAKTKYVKGELKGYFHERWNSKESREREKIERKPNPNNAKQLRERRRRNAKIIKDDKIPKRLNPKTGKEFKRGDFDPKTKKYFESYMVGIRNGYVEERWESKDSFIRSNFGHLLRRLKSRSKKYNLPCDVDLKYLMEIFPKDGKCPVFGTKFAWGSDFVRNVDGMKERSSPSVDRIIPEKGYIKGNIAVISIKANGIKTDATPDEIIMVAEWLKKQS